MSTSGNIMSTSGDVQYIGDIMRTLGVFSTLGGYHDYMSTLADIQYIGGIS